MENESAVSGMSTGIEEVKQSKPEEVSSKTGVEVPAEPKPAEVESSKTVEDTIDNYIGSEKVNPTKRPLKNFKRDGMSKEDIDKLIEVSGSEIFLSDSELAALEKNAGKEEKKEEAEENKELENKDEKTEEPDEEIKEFLKKNDLSQEEFSSLPEKIQNKLVETHFNSSTNNEAYTKLEEEHKTLKDSLALLTEDPYIAARLEEYNTGNRYIAEELAPLTDAELDEVMNADSKETAKELIDKIIQSKAEAAIKKERSVADSKALEREVRLEACSVFSEIGKIDKRLGGNITERDWNKLTPTHKEWSEYEKGPNKIIEFCEKKGITLAQVKKFGAETLYKMIAADSGWDKQRDENLRKSTLDEFLKKIKNPPKAKTINHGQRSPAPGSVNTQTGVNRDTLIEEIAGGNTANYVKLLQANDGNVEMIRLLGEIRERGERLARERRKQTL